VQFYDNLYVAYSWGPRLDDFSFESIGWMTSLSKLVVLEADIECLP
jgi:hypothetical protein